MLSKAHLALPAVLLFGLFVTPSAAYASDPAGNIQLVAPTQIQYRVKGDGTLISPTSSALTFQNNSDFEVRIASVRFAAENGFNIVEDASESDLPNSISIKLGTAGEQLDMSDYTGAKRKVGNDLAWTMATSDVCEQAASLPVATEGYGSNIRDVGTVGSVEWYVVSDTVTNQVLNDIDDLKARMTAVETACPLPVGSIIQLSGNEDPSDMWQGTTWEKIEGRFLLGSGSNAANSTNAYGTLAAGTVNRIVGEKGGEASHTLTAAETALKDHSHSYLKPGTDTGGTAITVDQMPSHTHKYRIFANVSNVTFENWIAKTTADASYGKLIGAHTTALGTNAGTAVNSNEQHILSTGGGQTHSHTQTTASATTDGVTASDGSAHNNMPPYEVVNIWKRTG